MKVTHSLEVQQSLILTSEIRLAIEMLAMDSNEIEELIDEELTNNPCLLANPPDEYVFSGGISAFDLATNTRASTIDFRGHLLDQIRLEKFNRLEILIAKSLIYNLGDDGLLSDYEKLLESISAELFVWPQWVESVRYRLMSLDPLGCAACSVNESLAHQARTLFGQEAQGIINVLSLLKSTQSSLKELLNFLGPKDYPKLKILNPRPSQAFSAPYAKPIYWQPDLVVIKSGDGFFIDLLRRPSEGLICQRMASNDKNKMLSTFYSQAKYVLRFLRFRELSLQRVAHSIVEHQLAWFLKGQPLKPLTLKQISKAAGLHESSISRLVRNKYIATDRGVFGLKYFFANSLKSMGDGDERSSTTIKEMIKKLILQEDRNSPESDELLAKHLGALGIVISRRTVAKYRKQLGLKTARQRRFVK